MAKASADTHAVMARRRAKGDNEGLTEEERQWRAIDFYGSPPWACRAGAEIAKQLWPQARTVREPACGTMSMAGPLAEYFEEVWPSDIFAHTPNTPVRDFFDESLWPDEPDCDLVMTNPPFVTAADFLRVALQRARLGVAMLVRTVWVESADRYDLFEGGEHPITRIGFFSERVAMQLGPWDPEATSATSYSWMFWAKGADPLAPLWFPPGTRDRLWRKDDPAKYGRLTPMPLFPEDSAAPLYEDDVV